VGWPSAIDRKLLRECSNLKGQIASIALVLAGGIACFIGMRGTGDALERSRDAYYERDRFADVFASAESVPETVARRIEVLTGVGTVQTRITQEVMLPIEGMERAAYGRLLSLPASGEPATNALEMISGRVPEKGRDDEVVLLEAFAEAHGFQPGDRVPAILHGKLRNLRIVGVAVSPEFVYAIRPGQLVTDPQRNAVLWMDRSVLASAFRLEGAFNEVSLRLQPGASEEEARAALDRILVPYGGDGAIGRAHQISNQILVGELSQLTALASMVPLVFLGVAVFLIHMVLGRIITLQRPEIATLKAIGYSNREIGRHYLGLAAVVLAPGAVLGVAGGAGLGQLLVGLYARLFRFPDLAFELTPSLVLTSVLAGAVAAVAGALLAVRAAVSLAPAEAMRPPAPARYRRGLVERLGLGSLVGPSALMVIREIERRPLRTLLSALGIGGAVALMILGRFGVDSIDEYLEGTLRREQRQDLAVNFEHPLDARAVRELARLPGVLLAEGVRSVPIRARHENRMRDSVLMAFATSATLRRLVGRGGHEIRIPDEGVLLTRKLGEILGLRVGDPIDLEVREGQRETLHPFVAGFVDDVVGLFVYARSEHVATLVKDVGPVSSAMLTVDPGQRAGVEEQLRRMPNVIDVSDVATDARRLREMQGSVMDFWTAISITLSASVVFGVVYNNARIALASRARDLASLRVLGLSRGEISTILIGSFAFEVSLAVPIGLVLGHYWAVQFMRNADQETFRFIVVVAGRTDLLAATVALLAAAGSALWVRRSLDRLDLIGVLKTRE
jgi:putative ABC transport system permease protein